MDHIVMVDEGNTDGFGYTNRDGTVEGFSVKNTIDAEDTVVLFENDGEHLCNIYVSDLPKMAKAATMAYEYIVNNQKG